MKAQSFFSPHMLALWSAIAALLFAAFLYFSLFGTPQIVTGPSALSRSAIGYAGIADVMHRLGAPIVKSRGDALRALDPAGVLVIAEPEPAIWAQKQRALLAANTVLLILPKWVGEPSESVPGWIEAAQPLAPATARAIASGAVPGIDVVRVKTVTGWTPNELGVAPVIADDIQLIKSARLRPVVGSSDGMLVGELRTNQRRLWILADPDVIENHGLPKNAAFAAALINGLRKANGNVVFDETAHGLAEPRRSSFWMLFEFPFVLATAQGMIAIALLLWATMGRFGVALSPPAALQSGKTGLIANTAKLFELARYQPIIVKRYVYAILRDAARQLHAPAGMPDAALVQWLQRTSQARAASVDCASVLKTADEVAASGRGGAALKTIARDIFRWKREIIDGVPRNSRTHRSDPRRGSQGGGRPG